MSSRLLVWWPVVLKNLLAFLGAVFLNLSSQAYGADGLKAGFYAEDVTPEIGVPLAGFGGGARRLIPWDVFNKHKYATFLTPSNGKLDPIRSKVMVLERQGKRLFFVSLDIVGADPKIREDLIAELQDVGLNAEHFFLSATHTHSGPGAIFKNVVWEFLAADRFNRRVYERFIDQVAWSIRMAVDRLEDAQLLASSFEANGLQRNRRDKNGPIDRDANLLWVKSDAGVWLGAVTNLALHGTAYGMKNLAFSADVLGAVERTLESRLAELNTFQGLDTHRPVVLYINGAEGDIKPAKEMNELAQQFGDLAIASLDASRRMAPEWKIKSVDVRLRRASLNLKGCIQQKTINKLILSSFRPSLGGLLHRDTRVWSLSLGDMLFMTWPGEPTTQLGLELKRLAREAGFVQSWVMGLTNDHMAYFTTREEYSQPSYESCAVLHGEDAGERLISAHAGLLGR
ncbi:MAG: neutral/alkaline non-lysosomal ceramidase N-terminal domain-containing protein [Oligoflexia bacterium]